MAYIDEEQPPIVIGTEYALGSFTDYKYGHGWVPSSATRVKIVGDIYAGHDGTVHYWDAEVLSGKGKGEHLQLSDYQIMMPWEQYKARRDTLRAARAAANDKLKGDKALAEAMLADLGIDPAMVGYTRQRQYGRSTCAVLPLDVMAELVSQLSGGGDA